MSLTLLSALSFGVGGLFAVVFLVAARFCVFTKSHMVDARGRVLPGPRARVLGGNLGEFLRWNKGTGISAGLTNELLSQPDRLIGVQLPHSQMIAVASPEAAKMVLGASHSEFPKSPLYNRMESVVGPGLVTINGAQWKKHRGLLRGVFAADRLGNMVPVFERHARELVEVWRERMEEDGEAALGVDVLQEMMNVTADIICETGFAFDLDAKRNKESEISQAIDTMLKEVALRLGDPHLMIHKIPTARQRLYQEAEKKVLAVVDAIIVRRRQQLAEAKGTAKEEYLVDALLSEEAVRAGMTQGEIRAEVLTFLAAGHETTANLLAWALYELARHPDIQSRARESEEYTELVLKETLRLHPPVGRVFRVTSRDTEFLDGKYRITKDTPTGVVIMALHRDPKSWGDDADEFVPERFSPERRKDINPFSFVPFSHGSRSCIGQRFAMLEAVAVMTTLLRAARFELQDPDFVASTKETITLRPEPGVPLRVEMLD